MAVFASEKRKKLLAVLVVLLFLVLVLINSFNAWIVLVVSLLVLLTFAILQAKKIASLKLVYLSGALLIISLVFLIFRFAIPGFPVAPIEISPSRTAELSIAKNVLGQDPLLGTGPGTFVYDYAKYHEANLNQTVFWGTRFISGASEIFDWFITKGILGGLSLVLVMAFAIFLAVRSLLKNNDEMDSWFLRLGILASLAGLVTAQIVYYSNFTFSFLFWLMLGTLVALITTSEKKLVLKPHSFLSIGVSFVLLIVLVLGLGFMLLAGQKYVSEVMYLRGAQLVSQGKPQEGMLKILSAANLSPSVDLYYRDLAQLSVSQLATIQLDKNLSDDQKKQQMQTTINGAASFANKAISVNSANIENWNVRGFVFRNLIGVPGADGVAIESYNKAHGLEPASPFSLTVLGRVYLAQAQSLAGQNDKQKEALNNALDNLNKAVELKSDYAPAHYLIALVYGQQGKTDDGIAKLEKTKQIASRDIGLAFQLGVLYYQRNELTKAQGEFERAISLQPNYSNARYMLGLVYDKQGQKDKAIEQFNKILDSNSDNAQVQKILGNLNAGKSALAGIVSSEPSDSDNAPAEIKKKK
jgi:tetratricopeptide (TPR) repeat protein